MTKDTQIESPDLIHIEATATHEGERLDRFISSFLENYTRSRVKEMIKSGCVKRDEKTIIEPNARVKPDDCYAVVLPPIKPAIPKPENIPLHIVYEDDDLVIVDKPAGLVVHPATGHWNGTLVNALLYHCGESLSGVGGVKRPGIVHRLDKETSGLMVVAKNDAAHLGLSEQFADHGREGPLTRSYTALVWGEPFPQKGKISTLVARSQKNALKMAVVKTSGREAITHYQLLEKYGTSTQKNKNDNQAVIASKIICNLETGRTHQIRLHLSHIGHPLIGDPVYGVGFKSKADSLPQEIQNSIRQLNRQALHATTLGFKHPISGNYLEFVSDLPRDIDFLEKNLLTL